ncbi:unnamed protein product [Musa acuminata subsp. malaccensis]|uniref:(wild Malaysian banana) hypothetical protein n=1 Tax=Musa acuminata subsp. malaccensis TaxID=214687 RepID=A0A804L930_MUSAM|nr:PREDICTED: uncharacterized protein LOC103972583 [Musa acuminata subsp. malaccensis]CAG1864917.1 unnamed protein product [Musa acuminata subsp. malaccensis]
MDPINIGKFQAMKRNRRRQALPSLMISFTVTAFLLGLFLSTLIWPPLCSSIKLLLFVSLPNMAAPLLKPEYLFIVCNLIVVFLVVESKLLGSSSPPDIYEEYMNGNTSLPRRSRSKGHRGSSLEQALVEEEEEKRGRGWEETAIRWENWDDEEEEKCLLDELNKRSEDLIARVTEQWRFEARMLFGHQ